MIDSHAHLDFPQYDKDRENIILTGFNNGLEAVINIGVDLETSEKSIGLAEKYENIYASVGVHPHDSKAVPSDYLSRLETMAGHPKVKAIGEIGLDYYRDHSPRDVQRRVFTEQLELAKKLKKPAVIHIREAIEDSMKIIEQSGLRNGVLHSFPGGPEEAKAAVDLGFHISFAGPITYPKSSRPAAAAALSISKILTETDSPYLAPQAFRGKRNQPENVRYVIEKLAEIFAPYTFDDIERITSRNARRLFDLPSDKKPRIVYEIYRSLYINLTNRCDCSCYFCPRVSGDGYVAGHYLRLKEEPSAENILIEIDKHSDFDEVVFCGLGEPTLRLKELLYIAGELKKRGHKVRLDTNGHGSLINKIDLPLKLKGLVDKVSISLNAPDADSYVKVCKPDRGKEAFDSVVEFIKGCLSQSIETTVSLVDIPEIDREKTLALIKRLGAKDRIRHYHP